MAVTTLAPTGLIYTAFHCFRGVGPHSLLRECRHFEEAGGAIFRAAGACHGQIYPV
jgi:hypothetical protein